MKTIKRETHNLELYVENQIKECFKRVGTVSKNLKGERVIEEFTVKPNEILEILYNLAGRAYTEIVEINYEILENDTVKVQVTLVVFIYLLVLFVYLNLLIIVSLLS